MSRTAALVLAVMVLAGCGARRPFDQGVAYLRQGQYAQARAAFDEAIREAPGSAEAYTNRGITRVRLGALAGALEDYTRAAALAPKDPDVPYNRGIAWIAKRAHPQAVADFTQALELDPGHNRARFARSEER